MRLDYVQWYVGVVMVVRDGNMTKIKQLQIKKISKIRNTIFIGPSTHKKNWDIFTKLKTLVNPQNPPLSLVVVVHYISVHSHHRIQQQTLAAGFSKRTTKLLSVLLTGWINTKILISLVKNILNKNLEN